uniref:Uncharacterized protein n=1 Tax=Cucumis melo TaxID=3656 RepID=A0A9I9EK83_CUCME
MDIDMIRVIRRDPRSPISLVFPPGSLQTSRGRGKGKGKLAATRIMTSAQYKKLGRYTKLHPHQTIS